MIGPHLTLILSAPEGGEEKILRWFHAQRVGSAGGRLKRSLRVQRRAAPPNGGIEIATSAGAVRAGLLAMTAFRRALHRARVGNVGGGLISVGRDG